MIPSWYICRFSIRPFQFITNAFQGSNHISKFIQYSDWWVMGMGIWIPNIVQRTDCIATIWWIAYHKIPNLHFKKSNNIPKSSVDKTLVILCAIIFREIQRKLENFEPTLLVCLLLLLLPLHKCYFQENYSFFSNVEETIKIEFKKEMEKTAKPPFHAWHLEQDEDVTPQGSKMPKK